MTHPSVTRARHLALQKHYEGNAQEFIGLLYEERDAYAEAMRSSGIGSSRHAEPPTPNDQLGVQVWNAAAVSMLSDVVLLMQSQLEELQSRVLGLERIIEEEVTPKATVKKVPSGAKKT